MNTDFSALLISGAEGSGRSSRLRSYLMSQRDAGKQCFLLSPFGDIPEGGVPSQITVFGPSVCKDYGVFSLVSSFMETGGSDVVFGIDDAEQLPDVRVLWNGLLSLAYAMKSQIAIVVPDLSSGHLRRWGSSSLFESGRASFPLSGFTMGMFDGVGGRELALGVPP